MILYLTGRHMLQCIGPTNDMGSALREDALF